MRTDQAAKQIFGAALLALASSVRASAEPGRTAATDIARRIVVSIPDRKLALIENDRVVRVFAVAVGAPGSPSPTGTFTVVSRVTNPTYYRPGKVVGSA
jgi:lipoprotein-anchoring transpeptidase ErfK/SrfK